MTVDILTLFPGMFPGVLNESMLLRAQERGLVRFEVRDIRDWALDRHRVTDDTPYGGGGGMVMKPEPIVGAIEAVREVRGAEAGPIIYLSPQGKPFRHAEAERLAALPHFTLLCGHYEGIDERVHEGGWIDEELSVGDWVLTGGELAAMIVVDAVVRLVPGVLGNEASAANDSFATGLLDCPHYTRPDDFRGLQVPEVLRSGHHAQIEQWRRREALRRTHQRRPELLDTADLSEEDHRLLREIQAESSDPEPAEDV
ncbi:tRNA (guanosine(37)-N1)-methyltransferase TrmD [Candidatus Sumerlaeota bacterium]|nr:tRNA (guanosine(37)-N1)-methyltransferase TrmD [Candidatus Sumerlaeota bacterium]